MFPRPSFYVALAGAAALAVYLGRFWLKRRASRLLAAAE
jgi:hypothetical protein